MNSSQEPERITAEPGNEDAWHCICGNQPCDDGFSTCDAQGNDMEANAGGDWSGLYRCDQCGRIIQMDTLVVLGINPNPIRL